MPVFKERMLGDIFRNQMVRCFFTLKSDEFESGDFKCQFKATHDPKSEGQYVVEFGKDDFVDLDQKMKDIDLEQSMNFQIEKFASQRILEKNLPGFNTNDYLIKLSVLYQVLHSSTAFIGVVKKKKGQEASDQEIIKININEKQK